jgi:hypothetical protein
VGKNAPPELVDTGSNMGIVVRQGFGLKNEEMKPTISWTSVDIYIYTHMLHKRYIYLQNWVILFG